MSLYSHEQGLESKAFELLQGGAATNIHSSKRPCCQRCHAFVEVLRSFLVGPESECGSEQGEI